MRWRGRRQSGNVEDRRGAALGRPGGAGMRLPIGFGGGRRRSGGLGLGAVAVILVGAWLLGVNPLHVIGMLDGGGPMVVGDEPAARSGAPGDDGGQFVAAVLADTEDTWNAIFANGGRDYPEPTLVLFTGATESACGFANAAAGPFYCPPDRKVYIDLAFYRDLRERFDAPGDFAQAYVIAHEVGHHVQNVLGILPEVDRRRRSSGQAASNELSVRLELQADCLAGVWAHYADRKGIVEVGDLDEALNAAAQIGDDTLQQRSRGYAVPESFTHGSAEQRGRWFRRGFEAGALDACDTFGPNGV